MPRFLTLLLALFGAIALGSPAAPPPPSYRIGGIVVDALTGQPLGLAEVTLAPVTALDDLQTFLTAPDGRFLFANLGPGKYRLMAGRRGYAVQGFNAHEGYMTAIVAGPGQDSEHLRFRLSPSAILAGAISDQWNDPVRDAEVILFQQSWSAGSRNLHAINRTTTNDLGRYRFAHLLPGTYAIGVIAGPWWSNFGIQSILVSRSGAQTGSSGHLDLIEDVGSSAITADPAASIATNPVQDLVYPVTYFPNVSTLAEAAKLSLLPGATETADVSLRPVPSIHLYVRVPEAVHAASNQTNATDGEPNDGVQADPGTSVEVAFEVGGDELSQISAPSTEISPGLFELSGIPPGDLTLTLSGSHGETALVRKQSLQLSANTELDLNGKGPLTDVSGVVLTLDDVSNQASSPDKQGSLMILFRSLKTRETFATSVSKNGEFSFAGSALPPGTYEVTLGDDQSLQPTSLEATGATVSHRSIDIPAGQPVKLTVHTSHANCSMSGFALKDGKPFPGAMIVLIPQDPGQSPARFHRDQSDSDGSFSMAPLFPGRYTLLAIENGWDLEWSNPSVLFKYLPNGLPVEIRPNAIVNLNANVQ